MSSSFQDTGLDPRILRALSKQGFSSPTPVQAAAIPAALQGKDIVARARTGSGKTLSYLLPALQRIVVGGGSSGNSGSGSSSSVNSRAPWQVVVLVPTRELCEQVGRVCWCVWDVWRAWWCAACVVMQQAKRALALQTGTHATHVVLACPCSLSQWCVAPYPLVHSSASPSLPCPSFPPFPSPPYIHPHLYTNTLSAHTQHSNTHKHNHR